MSANNQNDEKIEISYSIYIKEFPEELIKILQDHNIKFQVWENQELKEENYDPNEELPFVEINPEVYQKVKKISEITGISMKDMASNELDHLLTDHIPEEPFIFLDTHLGIENVKNPIEIIEQLKEIVNIDNRYFEALKTVDPIKYVKEWNTGCIKPNK